MNNNRAIRLADSGALKAKRVILSITLRQLGEQMRHWLDQDPAPSCIRASEQGVQRISGESIVSADLEEDSFGNCGREIHEQRLGVCPTKDARTLLAIEKVSPQRENPAFRRSSSQALAHD